MNRMQRIFWRLRFYALVPFILLVLPILIFDIPRRIIFKRKPPTGLLRKILGHNTAPPQSGMILVHGVSMGEVMLMKPLLPLFESRLGKPCMITSSTDTGWKSLEQHFPSYHRCFYPLDLPWAVWHFLRSQKPSMIVLLELELWPLFLAACFSRHIPVVLFNARIGDRSFAGYKKFGWFWRPIFKALHSAVAPNKKWAARLSELGVKKVAVGASLKGEVVQVASTVQQESERARLQLDERNILLIASTSLGEEAVVLESARQWADNWRIIICPRHPERGADIEKICTQFNYTASRSSHNPTAPALGSDDIIIVDEIGHLAALYALADIAVVGGSLGSGRHGQNMLESAAAGCCTVVGWDTSNQPDSMTLLHEFDAVVACNDAEDLHQQLRLLAHDADRRQALGQAGHAAWASCQGAAERSVQLLAEQLNNN